MKTVIIALMALFLVSVVSADYCDPRISLLNQDPYPAVPGDYVKLVFQIDGLEHPTCSDITFELLEDYPISFDPGTDGKKIFSKVKYLSEYESSLLIPYEVRIDENALDGVNPIEVILQLKNQAPMSKKFNLEVDDSRAKFETYVKDYSYETHELTIEVLNIADSDVEALTIEIPKQENAIVKGSNRVIVGDLDSNEYTSADFEVIPREGVIKIIIHYSDSINERRTISKSVTFDPSYFNERVADQNGTSKGTYIFWGILIAVLGYWYYGRRKAKNIKK